MFAWLRTKTPTPAAVHTVGRVTVCLSTAQEEPSYLVRGLFGNYLFVADLAEELLDDIGQLGGVKFAIPLRYDGDVRAWCERVFKRFGAHVVCPESFDVDAPRLDPSALPPHAERFRMERTETSAGQEHRTESPKRTVCELSLRGATLDYPLTTLQRGRTALPATWPGDAQSLARFLEAQPGLFEAYEALCDLFRQERLLMHGSPRHLAVAVYDDFEYDRIDYDTLNPVTRRTLRGLLKAHGATQTRGQSFEFLGVDLRFLKSPRTLSSPVTEGLSRTKDAMYVLTPTQLAALIAQDPESQPEELVALAQALPFNLDKLLSMREQLPLFKRVDAGHLRTVLRESGEFYRTRRQRGIRGRLASASRTDD